MKKCINIILIIIFLFIYFYFSPRQVFATEEAWSAYTVISDSLTVHSTPALGNFNFVEEIPPYISFRVIGEEGDFYKIIYGDDNRIGWVYKLTVKRSDEYSNDTYERPWNTPSKAISGGAKMIAQSYIKEGQFTSYLKKFQVNPDAGANLYSHQYMTNIRAPWGEARTSYKAYSQVLSDIAFTFTIPVFENMPEETLLSGMTNKGKLMTKEELVEALKETEISAEEFETEMDNQGFPESYKKYLRNLYYNFPSWKFIALNTGLEWSSAIKAEIPKSCIEVSSGHGTNEGCGNESSNWAMASSDSVKYFMDPRNFLDKESIFMFEDLSSHSNVTESMVQRILNGTFMAGKSEADDMNYATIFLNAGKDNGINPIYLASLSLQEVGVNGCMQTRGESFEWYGLKYSSLYNFYNIGATGKFTARGGLVWASGGSPDVFEFIDEIELPKVEENPIEPVPTDFENYVTKAGYLINGNYIKNVKINTSVSELKTQFADLNVSITDKNGVILLDDSNAGTGSVIILSDGTNSYSKIIVISGDVDCDGNIYATDYVQIKNHIMELSTLSDVQKEAADMNGNLLIDASDYVLIKNYIMNS